MRTPKRVVWSEGMLMSPQHLQKQDEYHEAQVSFRIEAQHPYTWGALRVELDPAALDAGQVRVAEFSGVLPGGALVSFDRDHGVSAPARPAAEHVPPTATKVDVFVGVPRARDGVANYASPGEAGTPARWVRETRTVADASAGASSVPVEFGEPTPRILFGDEPRGDYETIKVAELVRGGAGNLQYDGTYVPPSLSLGASQWLQDEVERLLASLVGRQRSLEGAVRQRDGSSVEFLGSDVTRYLVLSAINTYLPIVKHLKEEPAISPHFAYIELARLAGHLSSFSAQAVMFPIPPFNHNDLRGTFYALAQTIHALLGATVMENFIPVTLAKQSDGSFQGALSDDRLVTCTQFFLAARSDLPEPQVAELLPKLCKLGSRGDIDAFVSSALPGVPVQVTYRPPAQIPVRAGTVYFRIDSNNPNWRNVIFERSVVAFLPPPLGDSAVELQLLGIPK